MATERSTPSAIRPPSRRAYVAFGLLSTLLGMAVGHLTASLLRPDSSPVLVVGSTVIDATPASMKEWAIRTFESDGFSIGPIDFAARNYDKVVLVGSVLVGVLVLSCVAGLLARRSFRLGAGLLLLLVGTALVMAVLRPNFGALDVVPALTTAVAGVATLWVLDRSARGLPLDPRARSTVEIAKDTQLAEPGQDGESAPVAPKRRTVLLTSGAVVAIAAGAAAAGRWISGYRARPEDITLPDPASGQTAPPLPRGLEEQFPEITPLQVPNSEFYRVDTRLDVPVVASEDWSLTVDGDVENELTITFDELLAMPMVERDITLTCVSNSVGGKYVGGARWLGVPLSDILAMAGVGGTADQILSTDVDGMTISTPLDLATDGRDALIAVGMNGEPLPREHGFPVRMVIPGLYGFISATKWLTRLTLTTYAEQEAYWTKKKWATDAPIKPSARIDTPKSLETVSSGRVLVGGVAWAQNDDGVKTVEVQVDGGPWQPATLGPDLGSVYWRQWYLEWEAEPGRHLVKARVKSGDGDVQTDVRAEPFPEGSSGVHSVTVTVE